MGSAESPVTDTLRPFKNLMKFKKNEQWLSIARRAK